MTTTTTTTTTKKKKKNNNNNVDTRLAAVVDDVEPRLVRVEERRDDVEPHLVRVEERRGVAFVDELLWRRAGAAIVLL